MADVEQSAVRQPAGIAAGADACVRRNCWSTPAPTSATTNYNNYFRFSRTAMRRQSVPPIGADSEYPGCRHRRALSAPVELFPVGRRARPAVRRSSTAFWSISACRRRSWGRKSGRIRPWPPSPYLPPFNRISTYREPGRINLNTIYGDATHGAAGLAGANGGASRLEYSTARQNFVTSRRGGPGNIPDAPAAGIPTEFARPFRSFGGWALMPSQHRHSAQMKST